MGYSSLDAFKHVHFKRLSDIVSSQVLDCRLDYDPIRATLPRTAGKEAPSVLLILPAGFAFDCLIRIADHSNHALGQSAIHRLRKPDQERCASVGLRSLDLPARGIGRLAIRRTDLERLLKRFLERSACSILPG